MDELKTLKDIDMMYEGTPQGEAQLKEDLKQEAIKWVKEINKKQEEIHRYKERIIDGVDITPCKEYDCDAITKWIKHFFNITESDLKELEGGKE